MIFLPYHVECVLRLISVFSRKLLKTGLWDSVCAIDGILFDSDLYSVGIDCHYIVGLVLAEPKRHAGTSRPGRHYCVDNDHAHVFDQCSASQDLLRQVDWRVFRNMFRHGFRKSTR